MQMSIPSSLSKCPVLAACVVALLFGAACGKSPGSDSGGGGGTNSPPGIAVVTVPSAPLAVTAFGGIRAAVVSWSAPERSGDSAISSYVVTASPGGATSSTTGALTATVVGLENGTTYTFTVVASNATGSSESSSPSAPITTYHVPGAPRSVTAVPGNGVAQVSWTAPVFNGGTPVISYLVTASPGGATARTTGATTATVSGLTIGSSYTFTVVAENEVGVGPDSPASAAVVIPPAAVLPAAPTGVTAIAGVRSATVSWTAPADDSGSPVVGYTVVASPGGIVGFSTGATTATVSGLSDSTAYTFTVAARNAVGIGVQSAPSQAVTTAGLPGPPSGVVAVRGVSSAALSWTPPATLGGGTLSGYVVTVLPAGTKVTFGPQPNATVTGLGDNTEYTFTVAARTDVGTGAESAPSNAITTAGVPGAPTAVVATAGIRTATISWSAPSSDGGTPITAYLVTASPSGLTSLVSGATTVAVTGLADGTSYSFTVRAINALGTGSASAASTAVSTPAVPSSPVGVTATPMARSAMISWSPPASSGGSAITGYRVTSTPGGVSATTAGSTTTVLLSGLADDTSYTFSVVALNGVGSGPAANSPLIQTPTTPGAPTAVTATARNTSALVSWTAPSANGRSPITGYTVTASPGGATATTSGSTTGLVSGLTNGTAYTFSVVATNAVGNGPASTPSASVSPRPADLLQVVSGAGQSARPNESLAPLVLRLVNGSTPIAGMPVTLTASEGASVTPQTISTNASGQVTFALRLGRQPGPHTFVATATDAPSLTVSATAIAPAAGTIIPTVNGSGTSGNAGVPGPAVSAVVGQIDAIAAASDGTVFLADNRRYRISKVSPAGEISDIAGTGFGGAGGDGGPAVLAQVSMMTDLALDEARQRLYVADGDRVRYLDLANGTMNLYAGGGTAGAPTYGDNGPASAAILRGVRHLAVDAQGDLYIHEVPAGISPPENRIRRVSLSTGIIGNFLRPSGSCTDPLSVIDTGSGAILFEADGGAFLSARACGTTVGAYATPAILYRSAAGTLRLVAGGLGGGTFADGFAVVQATLPGIPTALAADGAGNLLFTLQGQPQAWRIDAVSGKLTLVAGSGANGFSGDFGPARQALLSPSLDLSTDGSNNLFIADAQNYAVRAVAGAGAAVRGTAVLSIAGGNAQTVRASEALPTALSARLVDGAGAVITGVPLTTRAVDPGAAVYGTAAITNGTGVGYLLARAGLDLGTDRFELRFRDIRGNDVGGSPLIFSANVVAPTAGQIFTIANSDRIKDNRGVPGPATRATFTRIAAAVGAPDGSVYFTDYGKSLYKLDPSGWVTFIASLVNQGWSVTGGSLAIDPARNRIYVGGGSVVFSVDLTSGAVSRFAGGGTANTAPYGDGGPAVDATFGSLSFASTSVAVGPDGMVYVDDRERKTVRVVDPGTGLIGTWQIFDTTNCTGADVLKVRGPMTSDTNFMAFSGTDAYFPAWVCGTATGGNTWWIVKRSAAGALTLFAAMDYASYGGRGFVKDAANDFLYFEGLDSTLRRVNGSTGTTTIIAGTGVAGSGADYTPATSSALSQGYAVGVTAAGKIVISSDVDGSMRMIW